MSDNDDLPGVVFHKKSSEVLGTTTRGVKRVKVILEAEVHDDAVWMGVEEKLNGLKIYASEDFKGEMLNALREDYLKLEADKKRVDLNLSRVLEENVRMKSALAVLHKQIDGMIFYLDAHPTKCAGYYAVDHLRAAAQAALQVLSDATRSLTEECRVLALEKKMRDVNAEVYTEKHWNAVEAAIPFRQGDLDTPLVRWVTESSDAWDWMLEFATDLVHEDGNWSLNGSDQAQVDATCWLRVHAPRPVNAGRILQRQILFPLPDRIPKEFMTSDITQQGMEHDEKRDITVRAARLLYYSKYRNSVRYTKARKPWWWYSFEQSPDHPALASMAPGK